MTMTTMTATAWLTDLNTALNRASNERKLAFLNFSMAPRCSGSVALEREATRSDPFFVSKAPRKLRHRLWRRGQRNRHD